MGRCKPLGELNSFLSYALQLSRAKSCLSDFSNPTASPPPSPSAITAGAWQSLLDHRPCVPFGESSFRFGSLKSLMTVTSLFIDMAGDVPFHTEEEE